MSMIGPCLALLLVAQPPGDHTELLKAIAKAEAANRAALTHVVSRFEYVSARVDDEENALAGKLRSKFTAEGTYVFDGPRARYERVFPAQELAAATVRESPNVTVSTISNARALTDGKETFWAGDGLPQINPGSDQFYSHKLFPLSLGSPDTGTYFSRILERSLAKDPAFLLSAIDEDARLDGRKVVHLTFEHPKSTIEFWVDRERGAIPVRIVARHKEPAVVTIERNDDLRLVNNKAWIPYRWTWMMSGRNDDSIKQLTVLEADFTTRPTEDDLTLTFAFPAQVLDVVRFLKYPARTKWNLSRLPKRGDAGVVVMQRAPVDL
jgi:hypothetical protein